MGRLLMKNESHLPDRDAWLLIAGYIKNRNAVLCELKKHKVEILRNGGTVIMKDLEVKP